MSSPLTVRNLTPTAISLLRVERFEDPNTLQSKAHGYFLSPRSTTPATPTSPELSGHAQSFNHQDVEVTLQPFESYTLKFPNPTRPTNAGTLSSPVLRITIQTPKAERYRIDSNPSYTQKSTQALTALSANSSTKYNAIFHPSKPIPHLAIQSNHIPSYASWMSTLPDNLPLSAISIPGTHNSHTHYRALPSVRCQVHDIKTQLENGIRFLDIRVQPIHATDTSKKDLYLVHGAFPISLTGPRYLGPILQTCYDFLAAHPSETLLVSLKREGVGSATDEHLAAVLEKHYITPNFSRWYTENKTPYLGSVRGKLILLRRYTSRLSSSSSSSAHAEAGLDATAWPHNSTHAIFPSSSSSSSSTSPTQTSFCLQDYCEVLIPSLIPTKLAHCTEHLARAAAVTHPIPGLTTDAAHPVPPAPLHLNFLSASNFWKRACWPSAIAKVVNEAVERRIWVRKRQETGDGSTGVVIMDCVGENGDWDLVRLVIGMNMGILLKYPSFA
ncbi:hypothetical protein COCMIDRAFT_92880 [Bipolaris oryzae ATCC 44560]|uniref:Phosphatidylinositol-specific phospholipase C X domain-containing protein n=1 Tax=Bipolaris oryzae ATCC 44560 TaxID=930090 RepID=W6ZRW6_COCMI|nr:uncharacterized protein COCMIDRAFT_92880 [Bipolaris oryzae ATCC 44560]EUC46446.1 hypothetical protein COCMIDRAFT_92880 [Bipolaris oryzae ATCC 44560]